jgi:hypothetical protein
MPDDNPAKKSFETGARTAREAMEKGTAATEQATRQAEQSYSSAAQGILEFNIKLMDIAQINTMANLNFATQLMRAKGPTEAFELWSRHAQSHFQRLSDQSQELASLGQRLASSSAEPLTRGFEEVFKRAS